MLLICFNMSVERELSVTLKCQLVSVVSVIKTEV